MRRSASGGVLRQLWQERAQGVEQGLDVRAGVVALRRDPDARLLGRRVAEGYLDAILVVQPLLQQLCVSASRQRAGSHLCEPLRAIRNWWCDTRQLSTAGPKQAHQLVALAPNRRPIPLTHVLDRGGN